MDQNIKSAYIKPHLDFEQQLNKLCQDGLEIADEEHSLRCLSNINYYRLSPYWIPFKTHENPKKFQPGSSFSDILDLYEFDRKLRLIVIDALERIEISMKTNIAYYLANEYGVFSHEDVNNFHKKFKHREWLEKIRKETERSKEPFIKHFKSNYREYPKLPIWVAIEIVSFGAMSHLFKGLKSKDKQAIANTAFDLHYKTLENWLHFLTYIRNICAHHSRLWNKEFAIKPTNEGLSKDWLPPISPNKGRCFFLLLMLKNLLTQVGNTEEWKSSCEKLFERFLLKHPWSYSSMGMNLEWRSHPLW